MFCVPGPRACFGELSLLNEKPRAATVIACEAVELFNISRFDFFRRIDEEVCILYFVLQSVTRKPRNFASENMPLHFHSNRLNCLILSKNMCECIGKIFFADSKDRFADRARLQSPGWTH